MNHNTLRVLACALSLAFTTAAMAAPVIYPAKGQTAKQQDKDKYECYDWARGETGFDPAQAQQPAQTTAQGSQQPKSAAGMVRGAAGGAAVAELTHHDAGRGAAIGVVGAAARERMKEAQANQARQQQASQQQAIAAEKRATYERAFGVCMQARGYAVK
jgi:hypothetical protein